ncbi:MAG: hypothetical protein H7A24_17430 [Leptospiraceae bacterium]|nr:hypothetical protein [Leptospiraceae bacterium]MCP5513675.1 hypothetical protein [Leptospiraceae bacterium]
MREELLTGILRIQSIGFLRMLPESFIIDSGFLFSAGVLVLLKDLE